MSSEIKNDPPAFTRIGVMGKSKEGEEKKLNLGDKLIGSLFIAMGAVGGGFFGAGDAIAKKMIQASQDSSSGKPVHILAGAGEIFLQGIVGGGQAGERFWDRMKTGSREAGDLLKRPFIMLGNVISECLEELNRHQSSDRESVGGGSSVYLVHSEYEENLGEGGPEPVAVHKNLNSSQVSIFEDPKWLELKNKRDAAEIEYRNCKKAKEAAKENYLLKENTPGFDNKIEWGKVLMLQEKSNEACLKESRCQQDLSNYRQ